MRHGTTAGKRVYVRVGLLLGREEEVDEEEEGGQPVCEVIKMMSSPKHAALDWTAPRKSPQTLLMPSASTVIGA